MAPVSDGRRLCAALGALLLLAATWAATAPRAPAQEATTDRPPSILIVNRSRVLAESAAARALAMSERELGAELQEEVDRVQAELAAEEEELARIRGTLPREAFEERADIFRERVQRERRAAQAKAAAIDKVFREARRELVARLQPILEEVRRRKGADVIINAESVLTARSEADVTSEVLLVYDARVPPPTITMPEAPLPPEREEGDESPAD
ncbi:MAG: OmpH family outer membrane protein [Pseudomonadota bacterium]